MIRVLHIQVPEQEFYDEEHEEFITVKAQTLTMEHSLISVSKWEAKWKKPYLSKDKKTNEEILDYLRCMTIGQAPELYVYRALPASALDEIAEYINDSMTATTFHEYEKRGFSREIVTSEIIYYWMIAQNIPPEYEKWHLNRLLTLIKVCSLKNNPHPKKMSRAAIAKQNRELNAARRKKYGTRG